MVQGSSKPLSEDGTEGRRGPPQPLRQPLEPVKHVRREGHVSRLRSRRPTHISLDDLKPGRAFGITATMMAWAVLVVGIGIAVIGTVQAMRMAGDDEPAPLAAVIGTEALSRQVEQLKIDLDRERAEKQDLLQKLAAVQSLAASSTAPAIPAAQPEVTVPAAEEGAVDIAEPAPAEVENNTSVAVSEPAPSPPVSAEQPLPAPMAPSAELLKPTVPAVAEPESGYAAASGFAVHLASFADRVMAERGWTLLRRNHPAALGDLTPRIEDAKDDTGNPIYLLLAGPFQTQELAAAHCKSIRSQVVFCKPRPFVGSEVTAVQ